MLGFSSLDRKLFLGREPGRLSCLRAPGNDRMSCPRGYVLKYLENDHDKVRVQDIGRIRSIDLQLYGKYMTRKSTPKSKQVYLLDQIVGLECDRRICHRSLVSLLVRKSPDRQMELNWPVKDHLSDPDWGNVLLGEFPTNYGTSKNHNWGRVRLGEHNVSL